MADAAHTQKHPYHLVDPSPWPAIGATGALLLALGAAFGMHPNLLSEVLGTDTGKAVESFFKSVGWWIIAPGLLIIFATMFWWWSDVIVESRKYHTAVVQLGLRYGMILFIASEVLFFAAFFWAFFDAALYPSAADMPPCAATVWLRVGNTFVTQAVFSPDAAIPSAARSPAPPAPTS